MTARTVTERSFDPAVHPVWVAEVEAYWADPDSWRLILTPDELARLDSEPTHLQRLRSCRKALNARSF